MLAQLDLFPGQALALDDQLSGAYQVVNNLQRLCGRSGDVSFALVKLNSFTGLLGQRLHVVDGAHLYLLDFCRQLDGVGEPLQGLVGI